MKRALLIIFSPLIVILVAAAGIATIGYLNLDIGSEGVKGVRPRLDTSFEAIVRANAAVLRGDLVGASGEVVEAIEMQIGVDITNESPVPVLIPSTEHIMLVDGVAVSEPILVDGGVLASGETESLTLGLVLVGEQLPPIVLKALFNGGSIDYVVRSRLKSGPLSWLTHDSPNSVSVPGIVHATLQSRGAR